MNTFPKPLPNNIASLTIEILKHSFKRNILVVEANKIWAKLMNYFLVPTSKSSIESQNTKLRI